MSICNILELFPPVWEVRHGSVMALREILTHQGGCAGVLTSDSCDDVSLTESEDKIKNGIKREREIDLNMQITTEETEPVLKRQKSEIASFDQMDELVSTSDIGSNGEIIASSVKVEPHTEVAETLQITNSFDNKDLVEKVDILEGLHGNNELANLIKRARNSSLKNSELLQDCGIRFLCVLSLDRYVSYTLSLDCFFFFLT